MAKGGIILFLLSTLIMTSWCRNGILTPIADPKTHKIVSPAGSSGKKIAEQMKGFKDSNGDPSKFFTPQDAQDTYLVQQALITAAYYTGTKAKGVPFGMFLGGVPTKTVTDILGKGGKGDNPQIAVIKDERNKVIDFTYNPVERTVPFLINYGEQNFKLIYVKKDKDLKTIPTLEKLQIFLFGYTEFTLNAGAHFEDAADWYYDDEFVDDGYYENVEYDADEYYEDYDDYEDESDGLWYQYGGRNRYNVRNQYDRNGLYRLRNAYRNGLFQN